MDLHNKIIRNSGLLFLILHYKHKDMGYFEDKDLMRLTTLFTRSKGDMAKLTQYAQNMANKITDITKAERRANAAEHLTGVMIVDPEKKIESIFRNRASDLRGI